MPRRATGQVIEPTDGRSWAIRFRAYGKRRYVTLGTAEEGWNRRPLDWPDFDPASGMLRVGASKTEAGVRHTPHSLRRLYASLRFALGDDPVYVAAQLGHTEPGFSMKVYASAVRRRERLIGAALREFDAALEWAAMGSGGRVETEIEQNANGVQSPEAAQQSLFAAIGPDSSAG